MNPYRALIFRLVSTSIGRKLSRWHYSTFGPYIDRMAHRLTGGRITSGTGLVPVLLITTTGRKTGQARTTPVVYLRDGDDIILVASNVGNPGPPQWLRNLRAKPTAKLAIEGEARPYLARIAGREERARLWPLLTRQAPTYGIYQEQAGRTLPVVVMTPVRESRDASD